MEAWEDKGKESSDVLCPNRAWGTKGSGMRVDMLEVVNRALIILVITQY